MYVRWLIFSVHPGILNYTDKTNITSATILNSIGDKLYFFFSNQIFILCDGLSILELVAIVSTRTPCPINVYDGVNVWTLCIKSAGVQFCWENSTRIICPKFISRITFWTNIFFYLIFGVGAFLGCRNSMLIGGIYLTLWDIPAINKFYYEETVLRFSFCHRNNVIHWCANNNRFFFFLLLFSFRNLAFNQHQLNAV